MEPMEMAWTLLKMQKAWYDEETSAHEPESRNEMPSEEEMHYAPMDDMEEEMMDQIHDMHDDPEMGKAAWEHWVHQNTDRGEFQPDNQLSSRDMAEVMSTKPKTPVGVMPSSLRLSNVMNQARSLMSARPYARRDSDD
jgi:hypothetical protein